MNLTVFKRQTCIYLNKIKSYMNLNPINENNINPKTFVNPCFYTIKSTFRFNDKEIG